MMNKNKVGIKSPQDNFIYDREDHYNLNYLVNFKSS